MANYSLTIATGARKFLRYLAIYGAGRSLFKAAGRLRIRLPSWSLRRGPVDIGLIGCGQFAFATIAYFLHQAYGRRIAACYDVDAGARDSLARAMQVPHATVSAADLMTTPGLKIIYVASNHASHAQYAAQALEHGLDVYVEKPIAVSQAQFVTLVKAKRRSGSRIFAGYNRPFAAAIRELHREIRINPAGGVSLQCFVSGHQLARDHWYRRPEEGTRVCGNIGHWLDLMVHVLAWRGLPDRLEISLASADPAESDDNMCINITTDRGDLLSVMLTSRCEPFEGINETINIQHDDTICKIDDFRRMTVWQGSRLVRRRYWPKDVGHRLAILQPFASSASRDWHEVELSTLLILHITDMARNGQRHSVYSLDEGWSKLEREIEGP